MSILRGLAIVLAAFFATLLLLTQLPSPLGLVLACAAQFALILSRRPLRWEPGSGLAVGLFVAWRAWRAGRRP